MRGTTSDLRKDQKVRVELVVRVCLHIVKAAVIKKRSRKREGNGSERRGIRSDHFDPSFFSLCSFLSSPALKGNPIAWTRLKGGRAWKVLLINMKRNRAHVRAWLRRAGRTRAVSACVLRFHLASVFVCCLLLFTITCEVAQLDDIDL